MTTDLARDFLFLPISGPRGASSRYRVLQFLPCLAAEGMSHALHLPPAEPGKGFARLFAARQERRAIDRLVRESRAVFIQKRLFPTAWIDGWVRQRPLLFDFDDAIFTTPRGNRSQIAQKRVECRLQHVLSAARTVIAGNRYLSDYAAQFARHVVLLPTVLDASRYPAKAHTTTDPITIGWIGHSVNHPYLAALSDVLTRLATRFGLRVLVISDRDLALPGVDVENRRWSEATEVDDILCMDIGIMPMPDDPWSRGKCGFKAIQYMAAGIPVVCAAVGANLDIVRDGVDGFCVSTSAQWNEGLAELCASTEVRQRMGTAARQRAQSAYSLDTVFPVWHAALLEAIGGVK